MQKVLFPRAFLGCPPQSWYLQQQAAAFITTLNDRDPFWTSGDKSRDTLGCD